MKILDTARSVLDQKGYDVWSVAPDATVYEAVQLMAEKNIGAVLVMENDRLIGMLSERDYTRKIVLKGKTSRKTQVRDIMGSPVITITPAQTIEECMRLMTDKRVRHLPVIEEGKVIGILSIGNLVNWIITAQNATIDQMERYIAGGYPG